MAYCVGSDEPKPAPARPPPRVTRFFVFFLWVRFEELIVCVWACQARGFWSEPFYSFPRGENLEVRPQNQGLEKPSFTLQKRSGSSRLGVVSPWGSSRLGAVSPWGVVTAGGGFARAARVCPRIYEQIRVLALLWPSAKTAPRRYKCDGAENVVSRLTSRHGWGVVSARVGLSISAPSNTKCGAMLPVAEHDGRRP